MIKVGSRVKIIHFGQIYSTYVDWAIEYLDNFILGRVEVSEEESFPGMTRVKRPIGIVTVVAKHFSESRRILCGVRLEETGTEHIFDITALIPIKKKMTYEKNL